MKKLKKKLLSDFWDLSKKVKRIDYWFSLGDLDINVYWYLGEEPLIDVSSRKTGAGNVYDPTYGNIPVPILKKVVKELRVRVI